MTGTDDVASFGEALKQAFARLGRAELPPEERERWHRRLLAVTNTAKRDLPRAREQLERADAEWRARS